MHLFFIAFQYLIPQHLLSRLVARVANSRVPWVKNAFITWFHRHYDVDLSEALEPDPRAYPTFNAFFTRALRPDARTLQGGADGIVSPVDGTISQLGLIDRGSIVQAKGHAYTVLELLGGEQALADRFEGGHFATLYLSPRDYHRVHMPCDGRLVCTTYVPGQLFSVNQCTTENVPGLFARNERLICLFDTDHGPMALVMVGAMIVAGIETVWAGQIAPPPRCVTTRHYNQPQTAINLAKGEEMGRFMLGSTIILLFGRERLQWLETLGPGSSVRLGHVVGALKPLTSKEDSEKG